MKMTGARIIIGLLERQCIHAIAGIPGGTNLPLYDALARSGKIRHILARHEQGAGFIAQGMARVTGLPQVCVATSGPGATNLVTAIADARLDSIPIICITGQVPTSMIGTDAFQEVDTCGLSIPITKHNYQARSAGELLQIIPEAFSIAASGRPGPVLIDVPKDIQMETAEFDTWPVVGSPDAPPDVDPAALARAAEMIANAKRPVLYVGGGVIRSGASADVVDLAEKAGIPAAMTLMGLGAMPADHPLCLGMLGMHAAPHTHQALEACDLLIALGVRFDDRATGRLDGFCPNARVIHVDIDPSEIDKLRPASIGMVGDVAKILKALVPCVPHNPGHGWLATIAALKRKHPLHISGAGNLFSPYGLIRSLTEYTTPADTIVTDVGQHQMWTAQFFPFGRPGQFVTSGGLGTMGFGLPAAIGAAIAQPGSRVICISGDGSLMMNLQELATAVEEKINLKIILMNNGALGLVRQQQTLFYDNRVFSSTFRAASDFVTIARGFGVKSTDLALSDRPNADLCRALNENGPGLIHVPIDPNEMVLPMVPPGAANRDMISEYRDRLESPRAIAAPAFSSDVA